MLLAKGKINGRKDITLIQHTKDVCDAAQALFGTEGQPTRLGECWLRFFRLDPIADYATFWKHLWVSCLFHDWGKANQGMQDVLNYRGKQAFRHEHLSVLMLMLPGVQSWLKQRADIDWVLIRSVVGSHHLKFTEDHMNYASDDFTTMLIDDDEFNQELMPLITSEMGLKGQPTFPKERVWSYGKQPRTFPIATHCEELFDELDGQRAWRKSSQPQYRMLMALRAGLFLADGAGSGIRRRGLSISDWICDCFAPVVDGKSRLYDFDRIQEVVTQRVEDLARRNKWKGSTDWNGSGWNDFQREADQFPSRTLLLAPCGSGKTLAAWRWIAAQAKRSPVKRVLFLYPTRATATEGFKDYVSWAPDADASLLHGTSGFDLNDMFPVEDPRFNRVFNETDPRLYAIQHWRKQIFSATVDQFLAFMSYTYGPMCLLPMLADSVIVFDEVHSFDQKMFSALIGFLESFDVPVLCMTATLEAGRKKQLEACMDHVEDKLKGELLNIAVTPRYRVHRIDHAEAHNTAMAAYQCGKRVLWVVNQVSRAQEIAKCLMELQAEVVCYHSRFRLEDRVTQHQLTIQKVQAGQGRIIAVSTQVCEMSLDIDADVLISEECPISSLIQRMGRCRRGRDEIAAKGPGDVYIYKPDKERVYSDDQLKGVDGFLEFLAAKDSVSQADLEDGLKVYGSVDVKEIQIVPFLCSGAYADGQKDSFRDIEAYNVQTILDTDLDAYLAAEKTKPETQPNFIVPVPRWLQPKFDSRLPNYLRVSDARHYDSLTGYWNEPQTEEDNNGQDENA